MVNSLQIVNSMKMMNFVANGVVNNTELYDNFELLKNGEFIGIG